MMFERRRTGLLVLAIIVVALLAMALMTAPSPHAQEADVDRCAEFRWVLEITSLVNRCSVWIGVTWEDEGDHCRAGCNLYVAPHSERRVPPPVGKLRWWVCAGETCLDKD